MTELIATLELCDSLKYCEFNAHCESNAVSICLQNKIAESFFNPNSQQFPTLALNSKLRFGTSAKRNAQFAWHLVVFAKDNR